MVAMGRARATTATTVPVPVMGLNDRDAIANMKPQYAVIMKNWWPEPSELSVRKGSITHATGLPADVETVFEYSPPTGTQQIFAASGGGIYNVTASGAVGAAVVSGQTNNRWQHVAASTPGGNFVYLFNGADEPLLYDGTTWTPIDGSSTPAITGITDTTTIIDGAVFKGRLYLVEKGSLNLWYLPPAQIGGAAVAIDMGQIFQRGGHIVTVRTWTIDAGDGSDDHLVIISSEGEVAVYAGFDPSTVGSWQIIGLFYLGRPIGQRCAVKYGGDLLIICEEGVFPLGKGLLSASIDKRVALTDVIQNKIRLDAKTFGASFGWQLCVVPDESALILNAPTQFAPKQYAMNTITGAWTEFEGWPALCWLYAQAGLFFGGDKKVVRAWVQNSDDGTPIVADVLPAFAYFGTKALNKFFTLVRPYLATGGTPSIRYALNGDFQASDPQGVLITSPPSGMVWGSMTWGGMVWGGTPQQVQNWLSVGGVYKSAALRLQINNNQSPVTWSATDYVYTRGGIL